MDDVVVRSFGPGDIEAVVALWERCGLVVPWNDPRRDIETKVAEASDELLVAERAGDILGAAMLGFDGHRGWVYYLAVDPAVQQRGLGRRLMTAAEQHLARRGCPKINLMVRGSNATAITFYERLGYEINDVVVLGRRLDGD